MGRQKLRMLFLSCMVAVMALAPVAAECAEIELTFSHLIPEVSPVAQVAKEWAGKIEKASKGRVKITIYYGGALIPPGDTYKSILAGVCDIAYYPPDADIQPLSYLLQLPFIGIPSMKAGSEIFAKMLKKFPEMANEYKGIKIFSPRMGPPSHFHTMKKPVRALNDVKGMKFRTAQDKRLATYVKLMGATPVEVPPPDLYISVQRGIVDGTYLSFPAVNAWGLMSLSPYHTVFESGGIAGDVDILAFRLETWKKLPADIQKIIEDLEPWYSEKMLKVEEGEVAKGVADAKKMGHTIINISEKETKAWADIAEPIHKEWIKTMTAKGYNAQAIYNELKRLIAESKKKR